jgi:hypothetical protein
MTHLYRIGLTALSLVGGCPEWPLPVDGPASDLPVTSPISELPELEPPCDQADCGGPTPECLFGETFYDLRHLESPHLTLSADAWIRADADLSDPHERQQLVLAVRQSTHRDVSTVGEALERVDEHEVRRIWLTPPSGQPRYVVYEYGAGDNSYGAFFAAGDLTVLADIHDGDIMNCRVHHE